jgi:hypothetical protein
MKGPRRVVMAGAGNLAVDIGEAGAEFLVGFLPPRETDDLHAGRQLAIDREVVERGDELAVGEIPGGPEDDHGAGLRRERATRSSRKGFMNGKLVNLIG